MSGAIVLHMYFAQIAQKGWLNLLIAALPWHQRWLAAAPHFFALSGWSHWWGEVAMPPWKTIPPSLLPACLLRTRLWEWLSLIAQPVWLEARRFNSLGPPVFPLAIISRCPLVDSCSLPLERATDYLLLGSLWAPFTQTPALSFSLSWTLSLSLGPPDTHSCLLPQDTVL